METLDDLKREIVLLDDLRIALQVSQRFPDIGGKVDIILSDMQRVNSRIATLLNPNEGGMLVSEMVSTPQKGDLCEFWDDERYGGRDEIYLAGFALMQGRLYQDEHGVIWRNCKVIKKGDGNV